jgi:hypothetical protein
VVVKVENAPEVRPQTGLENADLIFEELVEGGMTRFAAVYQSDIPSEIGPVRSIRHVDASIATPIADAFVFSGGAPRTMRFVRRKLPVNITVVTEGGAGMYRNKKFVAPHNVFLKAHVLVDGLAQTDTPSRGFFSPADSAFVIPTVPVPADSSEGTPVPQESAAAQSPAPTPTTWPLRVSKVTTGFSSWERPYWTWNAQSQQWRRFDGGKKFVNPAGEQLQVTTVVVLQVRTIDAGYHDPLGNYVPRTVITGDGQGYVCFAGEVMPVHWYKEHVRDAMTLVGLDGKVYGLPHGKTWVSLVPIEGGSVKFKKDTSP